MHPISLHRLALGSALLLSAALPSIHADVKLPAIFGDHMVLQQGSKIPVWGWASPGEQVSVTLRQQTSRTTAAPDGKWRVDLPPVTPSGQGETLVVKGTNTLTLQDVLVGDVWIASGQSNMEYGIQTDSRGADAIAKANDPQLRLFFVPWKTALEPQEDLASASATSLNGKWQVCTPEVMKANWAWHGFSSVGYFFARDLRHAAGHPVGMIATYKGGTPAEAWTSLTGLEKDPSLANYVAERKKIADNYEQATKDYPAKMEEYKTAVAAWKKDGSPANKQPRSPSSPDGGFGTPANNFNAMVAPLIPFSIKGVIWYQGESNGDNLQESQQYSVLFPRMITDWREKWGQGDFPFLFVELANFKAAPKTPSEGNWAWVRDAQLKTLSLPNTGMASATDVGDATNIHPPSKVDVGQRLALVARHVAYGENIVYSGPLYRAMKVQGNKILIAFTECGSGLTLGTPPWTADGKTPPTPKALTGFGIAGEDKKFVWADAVIKGNYIEVSSPEVPHPVAVRYGWADNPQINLYNKEGLPASPFRTDDWQ
ncbi:MAG TPA: sialate O-acetylesterase [Rariglobus sp.]|nr:sialate O-acetylesterase [Rariglobus sp.]